jgi:hypothetical protein
LIEDFIRNWESGYKIVTGVKNKSKENRVMFFLRKVFYNIISKISETDQIKNFTGFGIYDKQFIDVLRHMDEPYPYFRGLIAELGFYRLEIPYNNQREKKALQK